MRKFLNCASEGLSAAVGILTAVAFGLVFASPAKAATAEAIGQEICQTALSIVSKPQAERRAIVWTTASKHLDFEGLASAIGGPQWKSASTQGKQAFLGELRKGEVLVGLVNAVADTFLDSCLVTGVGKTPTGASVSISIVGKYEPGRKRTLVWILNDTSAGLKIRDVSEGGIALAPSLIEQIRKSGTNGPLSKLQLAAK